MIKKQVCLLWLVKNLRTTCFLCFFASMVGSFLVPVNAEAQNIQTDQKVTVKGVVKDEKGEPAIGASVVDKENPSTGTITDIDGKFTLNVAPQSVLKISYVGYKSFEIPVSGKNFLEISLKEDAEILDEVVVVGYGVQKKASVTGSVAAISSGTLTTIKTPSVSNMLAGRLPGLRAVQRSGAPGDDAASVDIRGYGNMLVIVDGVERSYSQLDANDIESVSILKDASAAVYGFKGSNGVLLVTTKKGTETKPKIEYNGYYGWQKVTRYPEMMTPYEYAVLYNEAIYNNDIWNGVPAYSSQQIGAFKNGSQGTNWWGETMQNYAPQTSSTVSITGGSQKAKYYTSVGYLSQDGILKSSDWNYKRFNVRSNIDIEVTKGFKVNLSISGRFDDREKPYNADNLFRSSQMAIPIYSVYANNNTDYWQAVGDMPNPVHVSYSENAGTESRETRDFNSSMSFTWDLPWVKGLMAKGMMAYDYSNTNWKSWRKDLSEYTYNSSTDEYSQKIINTANLTNKTSNYDKPTYQISLNYNNTFQRKHDVSALVLWEAYNDTEKWFSANRDFDLGLIPEFDYGGTTNPTTGNTVETAHQGLVGRLNYAYDNRYLMELNFRYDGSYKFEPKNRWGFFPGVSLGWRISEEPFFKNMMTDMDNLKLRASYAKVGDEGDFDAFQYLSGYESSGSYIMGTDGVNSGLISSGMANSWLTWYVSRIMNFGFETSYKNGLISAEFDWFRRNRSGLPATRDTSLPTTFGEGMPQENLNSDINTGFEISIGHTYKIGDLRYKLSANFSKTRIIYDYVERSASTNMYDNWRNNTNGRYKSIQWGKKVIGQFTSFEEILNSPIQDETGNRSLLPGDLKFEDFNNDGVIDSKDDQPIGSGTTPSMYYGFNLGAEYKGFDLNLFLQGAAGHAIFISGDILDMFIQQGLGNGLAIQTNRWHRVDSSDPYSEWVAGVMPAARTANIGNNISNNSWSLHDASYLRLKTLELGYALPKKTLSFLGVDKLRVYINCNNIFTFTNNDPIMNLVDPESNSANIRYYPQMKTFNFGFNLTL